MSVTLSNVLYFAKVVVVFTIAIAGIYGFVIPLFFPAYKAYWILLIGVAAAALYGGYIGYQIPTADILWARIAVGALCAVLIGILVTLLSLFVIVNVRGS